LRKEATMDKIFKIPAIIFLLFHFTTNVHAAPAEISVEKTIPVPGFSEKWTLDGKIKAFNPENLYKHINGEAELYLPYGFEALNTGLYISRDNPDKALAVDVYKMGSQLDAFGIYSRYCNPDAAEAKIGDGSFVNDSQLMFYRDRFFVQLSASGSVNPGPEAFIECAKAIAKNIPGSYSRPKELNFINIPGKTPRTETYISQSVLGYAFFKKGLTAQATLIDDPVKIFIIFGENEKDAGDILNSYIGYLKDAKVELQSVKTSKDVTCIAQDPLYKGFAIRRVGSYLIGASNLKDPLKGLSLLDAMQILILLR